MLAINPSRSGSRIPVIAELNVLQQQFGVISGKMSVTVKGQEYTLQQAALFLEDEDRSVREEVYLKIADVLLKFDDIYFISSMIKILDIFLLTYKETEELRKLLKNLKWRNNRNSNLINNNNKDSNSTIPSKKFFFLI